MIRTVLDKTLTIGTIASFLVMVGVVLLQISSRYFLPFSVHWTEEAARISFLYTVACAAGLAVRDHAFVNVDLLPISLKGRKLFALQIFLEAVTLVFLIIMFIHSLRYVELGGRQTSASLRIRMSWVFAITAIIPASMATYTIMELVRIIRRGEAEPIVSERTAGERAEGDSDAIAELHHSVVTPTSEAGDER